MVLKIKFQSKKIVSSETMQKQGYSLSIIVNSV